MGHLRSLKMISTDIPIFYQWLIATSHTSYHLRDTVTQGLADFTNPKSRFWILRKGCSAVTEGLKKSWRPWDTGRWTLYDAKVISVNALQVYDSRPAIDMAAIQQWYQSLIWLSKLKNKKKHEQGSSDITLESWPTTIATSTTRTFLESWPTTIATSTSRTFNMQLATIHFPVLLLQHCFDSCIVTELHKGKPAETRLQSYISIM